MLSDEEKKAIEYLKRHIIPYYGRKGTIEFMLNDTLLNLIEKQSKEIEELKEDNKHQWEERCKLTFELENSTSNDKIKSKIEEIDEVLKGQLIEKIRVYFEAQKEVFQSLLEKE